MIRTFEGPTADHVWQRLAELFRSGEHVHCQQSRDGPTKETLHAAICIGDPRQRWVVSRHPPMNVAFAIAEVVWIVAGRNDKAFLERWSRGWAEKVGPGPVLHDAYGYRLRHHLGLDQLTRAYKALKHNPDSRQVVLQIWDGQIDLPNADGSPTDRNIPCNVVSLLKVRNAKLEWLQIIRSNDLFLGVPHNFIQFTSLQEIMAGWLGIECGSYNQISDSLHLYQRDEGHIAESHQLGIQLNTDSLALPFDESMQAFKELARRAESMITEDLSEDELRTIVSWDETPQAFQNILAVLGAEAARRHLSETAARGILSRCTNPVYIQLWDRWEAWLKQERERKSMAN